MDEDNLAAVKSLAKEAGLASLDSIRPILSFARKNDLLEVPDPYYGGDGGFENVLDLLDDACEGLLDKLNK